jgi:hypothetical protein
MDLHVCCSRSDANKSAFPQFWGYCASEARCHAGNMQPQVLRLQRFEVFLILWPPEIPYCMLFRPSLSLGSKPLELLVRYMGHTAS